MTHLSNYGNDRLALYTFESVIKFVQCWTNLELKQGSPMDHAMRYFDLFPEEVTPLWRVRKLGYFNIYQLTTFLIDSLIVYTL